MDEIEIVIETVGRDEGRAFVLGTPEIAAIKRAATESWNENPRDEPGAFHVETSAGWIRVTVWPKGHEEALRDYVKAGNARMVEQFLGRN